MVYNKNKGFTLIELLIVIAIIGILASIVLILLNSARNKAKIVAIKTAFNSIVPMASVCHNGGGIIQGGKSGDNICNNLNVAKERYPLIHSCGNNVSDERFSVTNSNDDNWRIVLSTCAKSVHCVGASNAYCDNAGCHFPKTGLCH